MVYCLRPTGSYRHGQEEWENEVTISISTRGLTPEQRQDIAETIAAALNAKYLPNDTAQTTPKEKS